MLRIKPSFRAVIARFCARQISPHELVENDSHVLHECDTLCCDTSCTQCMDLKTILLVAGVHLCDPFSLMTGWVCQWKPFWTPIGDSFQKSYLEGWIHTGDDSSSTVGEQCMANIPTMVHDAEYKDCTTIQKRPEEAPSASRSSWQANGEHGTPTWKISGAQGTASF